MKRFLLFCLILLGTTLTKAQNPSPDKVAELRQLIAEADSISNRLLRALPSTFDEFDKIFGYKNSHGGELYDCAYFIEYFLEGNPFVDSTVLYEKLISIAASPNSHWDADHINEIYSVLIRRIENNPKIIFSLLDKLDSKHTKQFWYFIFDSPHPSNYKGVYDSALKYAERKRYPYLEIIKQSYDFHLKREQDTHY